MLEIDASIRSFLMPDDSAAAKLALLDMARARAEKFLLMYEGSMPELWYSLIASNSPTTRTHVFADSSLAARPAEHATLRDLQQHGCEVVIGSSPIGRRCIVHSKILTVAPVGEMGQGLTWEGSTNFSEASWLESNSAIIVQSTAYHAWVKAYWLKLAAWAAVNEPDMQLAA